MRNIFCFGNVVSYFKNLCLKLVSINSSLYSVSLGVAFGIAVAFTPFFGLQIVITLLLCFLFKANVAASMIAGAIGNPITFPFIWFLDYKIGSLFFSNFIFFDDGFIYKIKLLIDAIKTYDRQIIMDSFYPLFLPMLVGGIIIAFVFGILSYFITYNLLQRYKSRDCV